MLKQRWAILLFMTIASFIVGYCVMFYPRQFLEGDNISKIDMATLDSDFYHNDCLHPCVRVANNLFAGIAIGWCNRHIMGRTIQWRIRYYIIPLH